MLMTPAPRLLNALILVSLTAISIVAAGQQPANPPAEPPPATAPAGGRRGSGHEPQVAGLPRESTQGRIRTV